MEYVSGSQTNGMPMPPGVTAITDIKSQKRANKTLSKAVSLHLEGKLEGAARLLSKAIDDGEKDAWVCTPRSGTFNMRCDYRLLHRSWRHSAKSTRNIVPRVSIWACATAISSIGARRQRPSAAPARPTRHAPIPCSGWASR